MDDTLFAKVSKFDKFCDRPLAQFVGLKYGEAMRTVELILNHFIYLWVAIMASRRLMRPLVVNSTSQCRPFVGRNYSAATHPKYENILVEEPKPGIGLSKSHIVPLTGTFRTLTDAATIS